MTQEEYNKSIETGELQLNCKDWLTHFGVVGFLFFMPLMLLSIHLFKFFEGNPFSFRDGEFYILIVPIIIGFLFFILQRSRLKFKVLTVRLSQKELTAYIEQLCKEWDWKPYFHNKNIFIAKTKMGGGSWGELVTILFNGNEVWINSICDPDKHGSIVSMGRNRENVKAVTDLIENINRLAK